MTEFTYNADITNDKRGIPSFVLTVSDGDETISNFAEQDYVIITSSSGVKRVYVVTTSGSTGTIITEGDSTGSSTLPAAIADLGTCVRFVKSGGETQANMLNKLITAVESSNGHGVIFDANTVASSDGPQASTFKESAGYYGPAPSVILSISIPSILTLSDITVGDNQISWEQFVANADDDAAISARIKDGMQSTYLTRTVDPGYEINNGEYNTQFIPGAAAYKKKVK